MESIAPLTRTEIEKLVDRYPFSVEEIQVLECCYDRIMENKTDASFLMSLALAYPYDSIFLPGQEMQTRVTFIDKHMFPQDFAFDLLAPGSILYVADAGTDFVFEGFLESIADTGRRGPTEALRVLHQIIPQGEALTPNNIIQLCYHMTLTAELLVDPKPFDENVATRKMQIAPEVCAPLIASLTNFLSNRNDIESPTAAATTPPETDVESYNALTLDAWNQWADMHAPKLYTSITSFVHNLLFHTRPMPSPHTPFAMPKFFSKDDETSDILSESASASLLFSLGCMSHHFGEKIHRLYSMHSDGASFPCLERSMLGYDGPTMLLIETDQGCHLGAYISVPWKDRSSKKSYGDSESFLFTLTPTHRVFHATGNDNHFMHSHFVKDALLEDRSWSGIGFGRDVASNKNRPRMFIPASLDEVCHASSLDTTYESGDMLPPECMETFIIRHFELWGIGDSSTIEKALAGRAAFRARLEHTLELERKVVDKTQFVSDLSSGLIPNKLYVHKTDVRGRPEFKVDENHGGYQIDEK